MMPERSRRLPGAAEHSGGKRAKCPEVAADRSQGAVIVPIPAGTPLTFEGASEPARHGRGESDLAAPRTGCRDAKARPLIRKPSDPIIVCSP
jgi:hypothetical protein